MSWTPRFPVLLKGWLLQLLGVLLANQPPPSAHSRNLSQLERATSLKVMPSCTQQPAVELWQGLLPPTELTMGSAEAYIVLAPYTRSPTTPSYGLLIAHGVDLKILLINFLYMNFHLRICYWGTQPLWTNDSQASISFGSSLTNLRYLSTYQMHVLSHLKLYTSELNSSCFPHPQTLILPSIFLLRDSHQHHLSLSSHKLEIFVIYCYITTLSPM